MIRKFLKYLKVIPIDILIYSMKKDAMADFPALEFAIQERKVSDGKKQFYIEEDGKIIHESFLFEKLFVLRLIGKKGPTIGDCKTVEAFKGKSIYPFVINHIARTELLSHNRNEVFIIVNPDNHSSIRGIEKAGFTLHTKIKAKRFLVFHYSVSKK